jgi:hypothetical protein
MRRGGGGGGGLGSVRDLLEPGGSDGGGDDLDEGEGTADGVKGLWGSVRGWAEQEDELVKKAQVVNV